MTVTVTNLDTGLVRTTITNETGVYRVTSLDPGRYKVTAELQGFRPAAQNEVILSVGATLGVNFSLSAGTVNEAIEVRGVTPDVQTEKADISAVVEQKKINDLPLVGRNVLSLAALQPGINGIGTSADFLAPEQGMGVTANGVRETGNSASIDGASINNGPWGGTMLIVPNVEAVQEFQVIANNPSAEFGRNAGATVSVITRGGTNNFSGSIFEFHRNQDLRARAFFENRTVPKPDFRRNDFGGSFGGPIKRDNSFFFFSTEIVREVTGNSANVTVETEQFRDWVAQTRPNSIAANLLRNFQPLVVPDLEFPGSRRSAARRERLEQHAGRHRRRRHGQPSRPAVRATAIRSTSASTRCCAADRSSARDLLPLEHRDAVPVQPAGSSTIRTRSATSC